MSRVEHLLHLYGVCLENERTARNNGQYDKATEWYDRGEKIRLRLAQIESE